MYRRYYKIIITSSCGNLSSFRSEFPNGTGMNRNNDTKNTHPVTTPIASGL